MFFNNRVNIATTAIAFSILTAGSAEAASIGFVGDFDVANFTFETVGNGSVDLSDAPDSISIVGTDDSFDSFGFVASGLTSFTTTVVSDAVASFDFAFVTTDVDGPSFDPFVVINDTTIQISDDDGPDEQFGSLSFELAEGTTFGFGIDSTDGILGSASVTISNFEAAAIPEPMTVVGTLLGGAALLRARRFARTRR